VSSGLQRRSGDDGPAVPVAGGAAAGPGDEGRAVTVGAYLALFLLGMAQAILGAFFYDSGPVPIAAIGFGAAIFGTCLLGGWGLRRPAGALAPAAGWLIAAFVLASGTSGGSVLITATTAGTWFLFGGAASAAAGLVTVFLVWSGPRRSRGQAPAGRALPGLRNAPARRRPGGRP